MLNGHARRESMIMDMDIDTIDSEPNTRPPTPPAETKSIEAEVEVEVVSQEKGDEVEVPKKMGNLMKELKQDVQQGAMEFNMDSFF
jgi:hypothetical protein